MRSRHQAKESTAHPSRPIRNPDAVLRYVANAVPTLTAGSTIIVLLDRAHHPLTYCEQVWDCFSPEGPTPHTIFANAVKHGATFVILVQQHAQLDAGAFLVTEAQLQHASKCALAGQLLDIPVLDYLIVNRTHNKSLLIDYRDDINRSAREYAQRFANPLTGQVCLN
jgi:DNA repair protein RadC